MYKELRSHIIKLFASETRLDGRKFTDYRPIKLETRVTNSAEGSARITMGNTDVLVGIKTEVMEPFPDTQDEGGIMVGAELLPLSNPDFELGPPSIQAIEIARVGDRCIR